MNSYINKNTDKSSNLELRQRRNNRRNKNSKTNHISRQTGGHRSYRVLSMVLGLFGIFIIGIILGQSLSFTTLSNSMSTTTITTTTTTETATATATKPTATATATAVTKNGIKNTPRIPTHASKLYYENIRNPSANSTSYAVVRDSSLTYRGIAGLGHRLVRMTSAFHGAKLIGVRYMWASWGYECGVNNQGHPDIFDHLFGFGSMSVANDYHDSDDDDDDVGDDDDGDGDDGDGDDGSTLSSRMYESMQDVFKRKFLNSSRFSNDVPGYQFPRGCPLNYAIRNPIVVHKAKSDEFFYRQLRSLFRFNDQVRAFSEKHRFSDRIVLGLHIRAGNGETGDFINKERGIRGDIDVWLVHAVKTIHQLTIQIRSAYERRDSDSKTIRKQLDLSLSPLIFLATDDPSLVNKLADATRSYNISTVAYPQRRVKQGKGVSFYKRKQEDMTDISKTNESTHNNTTNDTNTNNNNDDDGDDNTTACHESWMNQFIDATLLGSADAVVAAQYSSFSQAVPLLTVLAESIISHSYHSALPLPSQNINEKKKTSNSNTDTDATSNRFAHRLFCEMNDMGVKMRCYDDYFDWVYAENPLTVMSLSSSSDKISSISNFHHHKEVQFPCQ